MDQSNRPAESGHWYTRSGEPAYTVIGANGKERPTTVADARKKLLAPSVSGIVRCAAAPGLEHWKLEQMMLASMTLPRRPHEPEKAYIARVWDDSRAHAEQAAARGTAIHAAIQGHFEGIPPSEEYWPFVQAAVKELKRAYGDLAWIAERSFAHPLGYGGKTDLHVRNGSGIVVDAKTKEFSADKLPQPYDENAMQLSAYRRGLGLPQARCANLFVSVSEPGLAVLVEHEEEDLVRALAMFDGLLAYWKAKSKYDSAFALLAAREQDLASQA